MANLLPTKGNLIAAKRSRMLAQTGYELMDRKRNILIRELMGMMDTAKELQGQIDAVFTEAYTALQAANIRLGICDRIAEAVDVDDSLTLRYRSVMGVELPRIPGQSPPPRPEYGMGDTCSELDECYLKFYRVKELTRRLAEVLTLEPTLFLGLGVLAAVVFCTGLCIAVIKLRCPACGGSVYHQAMRAQEGIPFACPKCGRKLEMK